MVRKSVRITKVNLSDLIRQQHGQVEELESAYAALQGSLTISTEKDGAAAEAEASASMIRAQANMAAAQAQSSFLAFLRRASNRLHVLVSATRQATAREMGAGIPHTTMFPAAGNVQQALL
jgi:hypothetical protein